ncbi:MAG: endonuclease III [Deltaproteobacteria bacterium]|nr:endonuclease III [Deltaproteobacteria bacterium]
MSPPRTRAARSAPKTYERLKAAWPDATCALNHASPWELLIAVVLSAQTTDIAVNRAMPALMKRYPDARALASASAEDVEPLLRSIGMYRQKSKNIISLAGKVLSEFKGEVPRTAEALITLPGVGRKTANVVLGEAFGIAQGIAVDTHVQRVTQRLGWTRETEPPGIERDLMALLPREEWIMVSHVLIFHGRGICDARVPACDRCPVQDACPNAHHAADVGRKPSRVRSA